MDDEVASGGMFDPVGLKMPVYVDEASCFWDGVELDCPRRPVGVVGLVCATADIRLGAAFQLNGEDDVLVAVLEEAVHRGREEFCALSGQ